jgi:hypothetical protein
MRKILMAAGLAVGVASMGMPAAAQQNGLVNVDVSNIKVTLDDIISRNNLNVQVPVGAVVQVPIGLAANVCGVTVGVLSAAGSAAQCTAKSENTTQGEAMAIARALQRQ